MPYPPLPTGRITFRHLTVRVGETLITDLKAHFVNDVNLTDLFFNSLIKNPGEKTYSSKRCLLFLKHPITAEKGRRFFGSVSTPLLLSVNASWDFRDICVLNPQKILVGFSLILIIFFTRSIRLTLVKLSQPLLIIHRTSIISLSNVCNRPEM